jgi:hypothetical protein
LITLGCGCVVGGAGVPRFAARCEGRAEIGRIAGVVSPLSTPVDALAAGVTSAPPVGSTTEAPAPPGVITALGVGRTDVAGAVE